MKLKPFLLNSLVVLVLAFLGYGAGKLIGNLFVGESDALWQYHRLPASPKKIASLVYLQMSSTSPSDDPTGDSLFVKTEDGAFYSYTLFEDNWTQVNADPTQWNNPYVSKCTTEWNGPSEFTNLKSFPPVKTGVIDSMGENSWNYPSTSIARCYTLLDDGSLQVWTYSGNVANLQQNRLWKKSLMIVGVTAGSILSFFIIHYRTKSVEPARP